MGHVCALAADVSTLPLEQNRTSAHADTVHSVDISPDGTRMVSGSFDATIKLWGGRALLRACTVLCVLLTFGTRLGVPERALKRRRMLERGADASTLALVAEVGPVNFIVFSVSFSPDGTQIVSGSDGNIELWGGNARYMLTCMCSWRHAVGVSG